MGDYAYSRVCNECADSKSHRNGRNGYSYDSIEENHFTYNENI